MTKLSDTKRYCVLSCLWKDRRFLPCWYFQLPVTCKDLLKTLKLSCLFEFSIFTDNVFMYFISYYIEFCKGSFCFLFTGLISVIVSLMIVSFFHINDSILLCVKHNVRCYILCVQLIYVHYSIFVDLFLCDTLEILQQVLNFKFCIPSRFLCVTILSSDFNFFLTLLFVVFKTFIQFFVKMCNQFASFPVQVKESMCLIYYDCYSADVVIWYYF